MTLNAGVSAGDKLVTEPSAVAPDAGAGKHYKGLVVLYVE